MLVVHQFFYANKFRPSIYFNPIQDGPFGAAQGWGVQKAPPP